MLNLHTARRQTSIIIRALPRRLLLCPLRMRSRRQLGLRLHRRRQRRRHRLPSDRTSFNKPFTVPSLSECHLNSHSHLHRSVRRPRCCRCPSSRTTFDRINSVGWELAVSFGHQLQLPLRGPWPRRPESPPADCPQRTRHRRRPSARRLRRPLPPVRRVPQLRTSAIHSFIRRPHVPSSAVLPSRRRLPLPLLQPWPARLLLEARPLLKLQVPICTARQAETECPR